MFCKILIKSWSAKGPSTLVEENSNFSRISEMVGSPYDAIIFAEKIDQGGSLNELVCTQNF